MLKGKQVDPVGTIATEVRQRAPETLLPKKENDNIFYRLVDPFASRLSVHL